MNTYLMATLCPQQAPGREMSMLPSTSTSLPTPWHWGTALRGLGTPQMLSRAAPAAGRQLCSKTLTGYHLTIFFGGGISFKLEISKDVVFQTASLQLA